MTPQTIVVDGYDGSITEDTSTGPVVARVRADLDRRFPDGWQARYDAADRVVRDASVDLFQYHLFMPLVVRHHNAAVPAAQQYATLANAAARAVAEVDSLYADLGKNTTINWLAAHHQFTVAAVKARDLLDSALAAAIALRDSGLGKEIADRHSGLTRMFYEREVPAEQRIAIPDVDAVSLALTGFVETTRERLDILRATVSGGYPAGFAPAPTAPAPAPTGPVDDDWATGRRASVAMVAGRERGW
jgi:hypothetical protein